MRTMRERIRRKRGYVRKLRAYAAVGVLVAYLAGLGFAAFGHLVCDVKYIKDELSKKK